MRTYIKKILIAWSVFIVFLFAGIGGNNNACAEAEEMEHRNIEDCNISFSFYR
jgi:hypothetical protein